MVWYSHLLKKVKVESEKVGLKLNIQKTKIMASGHITSWEIDGKTVETVSDFIFGGFKITADGDCSHENKRCLRSEERRVGKEWKQCQTLFLGAPKSLQMVTATMILKDPT